MDWPPLTLVEHRRDTSANCLWSRRCRRLDCWSTAGDATDRAREKEGEETRKKAEKVPWPSSTADAFHRPQPEQAAQTSAKRRCLLCLPATRRPRRRRPLGAKRRRRRGGSSRAGGESGSIPCAGGWMAGLVSWRAAQERQKRRQKEEGNRGEKNCSRATGVWRLEQQQALLEHSTPLSARPLTCTRAAETCVVM